MSVRRQMIVIDVPLEEDENPAQQWLWQDLLDTSRDVRVMWAGPVYESEDKDD